MLYCAYIKFLEKCQYLEKELMMKKLFVFGFVFLVILTSLFLPAQLVSAQVNRVDVESYITDFYIVDPGDIWSNSGGMEFWRGVINNVYYTANDARIQGWCTLVMNRNIRSDTTAQGNGTWITHPDAFLNGYLAGTFTASIDSLGVMRVRMIGKGYGTLDGLTYSGSLEGSMMSIIYGVITELPTYSP